MKPNTIVNNLIEYAELIFDWKAVWLCFADFATKYNTNIIANNLFTANVRGNNNNLEHDSLYWTHTLEH